MQPRSDMASPRATLRHAGTGPAGLANGTTARGCTGAQSSEGAAGRGSSGTTGASSSSLTTALSTRGGSTHAQRSRGSASDDGLGLRMGTRDAAPRACVIDSSRSAGSTMSSRASESGSSGNGGSSNRRHANRGQAQAALTAGRENAKWPPGQARGQMAQTIDSFIDATSTCHGYNDAGDGQQSKSTQHDEAQRGATLGAAHDVRRAQPLLESSPQRPARDWHTRDQTGSASLTARVAKGKASASPKSGGTILPSTPDWKASLRTTKPRSTQSPSAASTASITPQPKRRLTGTAQGSPGQAGQEASTPRPHRLPAQPQTLGSPTRKPSQPIGFASLHPSPQHPLAPTQNTIDGRNGNAQGRLSASSTVDEFGRVTAAPSSAAAKRATDKVAGSLPRLGDRLSLQKPKSQALPISAKQVGSSIAFPKRAASQCKSISETLSNEQAIKSPKMDSNQHSFEQSGPSMSRNRGSSNGQAGMGREPQYRNQSLRDSLYGAAASKVDTDSSGTASSAQRRAVGSKHGATMSSARRELSGDGTRQSSTSPAGISDMGPPKAPASQTLQQSRLQPVGSLSARKPNLHLSLAQQPSSRFSAFSSADTTPAADCGPGGSILAMRPTKEPLSATTSHGKSSPSLANHDASAPSGSRPPSHSQGLGMGLPSNLTGIQGPSQRALTDLGSITSAYGADALAYHPEPRSFSSYTPQTLSSSRYADATPQKYVSGQHSRQEDVTQTPGRTPMGPDRGGQVGIGELTTPRWNAERSQWQQERRPDADDGPDRSAMLNQASPLPVSRKAQTSARAVGEARHARAISYSAAAPGSSGKSETLNKTLSPAHGLNLVSSPSVPAFAASSLAALPRSSALQGGLRNREKSNTQYKDVRNVLDPNSLPDSRETPETTGSGSPFSIGAISDSDDDMMVAYVPKSGKRFSKSPRIGDLGWPSGETGPFGIASSSEQRFDAHDTSQDSNGMRRISGSQYSQSNNTSMDQAQPAHGRLRSQDGINTDSLGTETHANRNTSDSARDPNTGLRRVSAASSRASATQAPSSVSSPATRRKTLAANESVPKALRSPGASLQAASALPGQTRRPRQGSSPTSARTSGGRMPSSSSLQSVRAKHASTASIGHSLLRGSLPFGVANDYEGRLSRGEDAAAEALRKLDGINTPRSSREREPSRSPHSTRNGSRPNSAGRRTPGTAPTGGSSRASSPSGKSSGTRQMRDDTVTRSYGQRRSSTSRGSVKLGKAGEDGAQPAFLSESPKRSSYSSPRSKRMQLPPLPIASSAFTNPQSSISPSMSTSNSIGSPGPSLQPSAPQSNRASGASTTSVGSGVRASSAARSRPSEVNELPSVPSSASGATLVEEGVYIPAANGAIAGAVPPVPPLPKAWESSRSASNPVAEMNASAQSAQSVEAQTSSSAQAPVTSIDAPSVIKTLETPALTTSASKSSLSLAGPQSPESTKSQPLKWSLSNLSTTLKPKRSAEMGKRKLSTDIDHASPGSYMAQSTSPAVSPQILLGDTSFGDASNKGIGKIDGQLDGDGSSSADLSGKVDEVPVRRGASSQKQLSGEGTSSPYQFSTSLTNSKATTRRTPSFFRKRSSEIGTASSAGGENGKQRIGSRGKGSASPIPDSARGETTITPTGRSSRKSILGLGNLLRSASRKNLDSMPQSTSSAIFPSTERQVTGPAGDDSLSSVDSIKSPKALGAFRRSSFISRRKSKPPTSSDEPSLDQPSARQGSRHASSEDPLANVQQYKSSDSTSVRHRLSTSSSVGDLQQARQSKDGATRLTPIAASPSAHAGHAARRAADTSSPTKRASTSTTIGEPLVPGTRIPRVSTIGSRKPQPQLPASASTLMARKSSGHSDSQTPSQIPTSKTTSTLASHLGIHQSSSRNSDADDRQGAASVTQSGLPSQSPSLGAPAGSAALTAILNAYKDAKTQAEVDTVLRRARAASNSTTMSSRDKEVLVSLLNRQEQKRQSSGETTNDMQANMAIKSEKTIGRTPLVKEGRETSSDAATAPQTPSTVNGGHPSGHVIATPSSVPLPRKTRQIAQAPSTVGRTARENATISTSRIGGTSSSSTSRQSPLLSSDSQAAQTGSGVSPSPTLVQEDGEREGDEEIEAYIRRRHARKVAQGANLAELEKMLLFPEPEKPAKAYSHRQAEALWGDKLTDLEMDEIRDYKEIFYVGQTANKAGRLPADGGPTHNAGYDDERGDYIVMNHDHLAFRYEVVSLLGRGSFGQVLQCKDHKTGKSVAIKLIRNKRRFHHQALVEVKILENLTKWDPNEEYNVIHVLDSFYFRNHLCISMELLSINLYELIKANSFAGFSTKLIRRITSQVLLSLSLLRRNRVVHCDLKPENILLRHPRKSGIKVIDFGSSCFEHEKVYTYIQSRFYRSPEVILGMNYHMAIDIWSLGCIIAELYSGYPLFPGENEQEQLACIMEILGIPERSLIDRSSRKKLFFDSTGAPRPVVNSKGKRRRPDSKTLSSALNCNDELFIDFLSKCLIWDPERRMKPDTALRHPWIRRNAMRSEALGSTFSRRTSMISQSASNSAIHNGVSGTGTSSSAILPTRRNAAAGSASNTMSTGSSARSAVPTLPSKTNAASSSSQPSSSRHAERRISLRNPIGNGNTGQSSDGLSGVTQLRASRRAEPVQ